MRDRARGLLSRLYALYTFIKGHIMSTPPTLTVKNLAAYLPGGTYVSFTVGVPLMPVPMLSYSKATERSSIM